jgi:hypothetical protein
MRLGGAGVSGCIYFSATANCNPESTSNSGRTEGRMARSVNMVLSDVDGFIELPTLSLLLYVP